MSYKGLRHRKDQNCGSFKGMIYNFVSFLDLLTQGPLCIQDY
jgi:hypothetical protein